MRLDDHERVLAMLLTSQLKAPTTFFIEEADLDASFEINKVKAPPTAAQMIRTDYVAAIA
jgi:hypothetical protein